MDRCVVVGAGIGGLTAAAGLAHAGLDVTVVEAQSYPGGCAGTFYRRGYHFDAGATLAGGFYSGGPMDLVAKSTGIDAWPTYAAEPALQVHLPDGRYINRWGDQRRWEERNRFFGSKGLQFWHWQERTADAMWNLALRLPPLPPQSAADLGRLIAKGLNWFSENQRQSWHLDLVKDAFQPVARHLSAAPDDLKLFVDSQLLISAQTTSMYANALFAAAALDLPRRGVVHFKGGMGAIAQTMIKALQQNGGKIYYRQEATRVIFEGGKPLAVETEKGGIFPADIIIFNLPLWNIEKILAGDSLSKHSLKKTTPLPDKWGAFVVYIGLGGSVIPESFAQHHQIITGQPLAEGNSAFLSISPAWDESRAPKGKRAITMSAHTALEPWWQLKNHDQKVYQERKMAYTAKMLDAGEKILPGLREAAEIILPGTPVTFQRFTGRIHGWVGGFPQTNLLRFQGPRLSSNLWMVGDSIFPGQSVTAVALGGLRVAQEILKKQYAHAQDMSGQSMVKCINRFTNELNL